MSPAVYPKPDAPARPPNASFSPLPDAILALVRDGRLLRADAPLLHALLTFKRRGRDEVWPRQQTLADALGCSVRTVQRGLDRLCAAQLIDKRPRRTPAGSRARGLRYDLSALSSLMPARAPRLSSGAWGGPNTRHPCRPESDSDVDKETDTPNAPAAAPEASPEVVAALAHVGVFPSAAARLVQTHGPGRCRAALAALSGRPDVRDRPAWLVACLRDGWALAPKAGGGPTGGEGAAGDKGAVEGKGDGKEQGAASRAPTSPSRSAPAADPLDALPPAQYADWEQRARAELIADVSLGPVVRSSLSRGRSTFLVRARMRRWLPPAPSGD